MSSTLTRRGMIVGSAGTLSVSFAANGQTAALETPPTGTQAFAQAGRGARLRSQVDKLRETVSLADFIVQDGKSDATRALYDAIEALGPAGGIVEIPPGDWAMNAVIARDNITLRGKGGAGELMQACVRPFDLSRPTLTFGDDSSERRYCGLIDLHVSGASGERGSGTRAAAHAPQALLLRGGTVNFTAINSVFFGGMQTVAMRPSRAAPVTGSKFLGCTIRNDIADSPRARAIYAVRFPDPGYCTSNKFIATKLNGPAAGYAVEIDGRANPIVFEVNDCYWDVHGGHGLLFRGSAVLIAYNLQIDPGGNNLVIAEADGTIHDPARYFMGMVRHGGQKMRFGDGYLLDIPEEAESFSYRQRIASPFFSDLGYFAPRSAPYSTRVYYDFATDSGPMRWHGIQHRFMDTSDAAEDLDSAGLATEGGLAVRKSLRVGQGVHAGQGYFVGANQVLGPRQPRVASPQGGKIVDAEARRAIDELLKRLQAHGLLS